MTSPNSPVAPQPRVMLRAIGGEATHAPTYLVKGIFPASGVALLAGQYASGKTFVAADLMLSVCLGQEFMGKRTKSGGGLWLAAEGAGEVEVRVAAARAGKFQDGVKGNIPFLFSECLPHEKIEGTIGWIERAITSAKDECCNKFDTALRLVVIDTLAAAFALEDENGNAEAARIMKRLGDLGNQHDVLILPVTHMGKNADSGVRGASAYGAGADAILTVIATTASLTGDVSKRSVALAKSRRGGTGPMGGFTLPFQVLGLDDDGDPFGSCFVQFHANDNQAKAPVQRDSRASRKFSEAFDEALMSHGKDYKIPDGPTVRAISVTEVQNEFYRRYLTGNPGNKPDAKRKAWNRAFEAAEAEGGFAGRPLSQDLEIMWRVR